MQPIRYRFDTKDWQFARVDLTQVRSILPSGARTGFVKLVLDGGHSITVAGDVEAIENMLGVYCLHPIHPDTKGASTLLPEQDPAKA